MGKIDRIIRSIVAILIIVYAYKTNTTWVYFIALIPILTSGFSFCPLYVPFKFCTNKCKTKK